MSIEHRAASAIAAIGRPFVSSSRSTARTRAAYSAALRARISRASRRRERRRDADESLTTHPVGVHGIDARSSFEIDVAIAQ
jgi:hypothetical protein